MTTMVAWAGFFTSDPADKFSVSGAIFGMLLGCAIVGIGYLYTFRFRVIVTDGTLIVVNVVAESYSLGDVVSATPGRAGLVFTMRDGTRCVASAVETGLLAQLLKRRTRADDVIAAVLEGTYRRSF